MLNDVENVVKSKRFIRYGLECFILSILLFSAFPNVSCGLNKNSSNLVFPTNDDRRMIANISVLGQFMGCLNDIDIVTFFHRSISLVMDEKYSYFPRNNVIDLYFANHIGVSIVVRYAPKHLHCDKGAMCKNCLA